MQQQRRDLQPQQLYITHLSGNAAKQYYYQSPLTITTSSSASQDLSCFFNFNNH